MGVKQEYFLLALHVGGLSAHCARLPVDILDVRVEVQIEEEWAAMQPVVMRACCLG